MGDFVSSGKPTWWQQGLQDAADRIAFLEEELRTIRDLACRGAAKAIFDRADQALKADR